MTDQSDSPERLPVGSDPAAQSNGSYGRLLLLFYAAVAAGVLAIAISAAGSNKHQAKSDAARHAVVVKQASHKRAAHQGHKGHQPGLKKAQTGKGALPGAEGPIVKPAQQTKKAVKAVKAVKARAQIGRQVKQAGQKQGQKRLLGGPLPHTP